MAILFLLLFFQISLFSSAITYDLNGGRFGDCLSTYCKAKWFSFKYKLPLYYKPFEYSDQLVLSKEETEYDQTLLNNFEKIVKVKCEEDILAYKDKNVLFVTNFYTKTPDLYDYQFIDPRFGTLLKNMIKPLITLASFESENGYARVALHVRKGGGYDKPLSTDSCNCTTTKPSDQIWPTKFPRDQYYLEQLQTLRKLIDSNLILKVYLFTDDPNPEKIAQRYSDSLKDSSIEFVFRKEGNSYNNNVIEDFFAMTQCDYLIRSASLYTRAVQIIGNHKIIIYPIHGKWDTEKEMPIMNPIGIIMRY